MAVKDHPNTNRLPGRFEGLVRMMPPRAIMDDVQNDSTLEMIDRLMAAGRPGTVPGDPGAIGPGI